MKNTTVLLAATASLALAACSTTQPQDEFTTAPAETPVAPVAEAEVAPPLLPEELFPGRPIVDYTIKPNDSLWLIAEDHKISIADIRAANAIAADDNKIIAGKTLRIPLPAAPASAVGSTIPAIDSPSVLTPSTLPGTLPLPPTQPVVPPTVDSGLTAPPDPPTR